MIKALLAGHLTWNISLLIIFSIVFILYFVALNRYVTLTSYKQPIVFSFGWWLLYVAIGSPLLAISYLSFSFHMIQMSFLYFIIPPIILLSIPQDMYKRFVTFKIVRRLGQWCISPKAALILFASLFFMYHLPFLLVIISKHPFLQQSFLTILFLLSFLMWWPIASPDQDQRLTAETRKTFVFQSGLYIMPACLLFIVSALLQGMSNPFLGEMTAHLCLPQGMVNKLLPPPFNTKYDQMLAGLFMMGLHKGGLMMTGKLASKLR